jgi:Uma2 family endonuclease
MALETERPVILPRMTEAEFEAGCTEDTRAEYVDGRVVVMSPVSLLHYEVSHSQGMLLGMYLECCPSGLKLGPEVAVRLRPGLLRVPDLLYLAEAHRDRLQATYVSGAPDAVWEIISADSEERDWRDKFREYEAAGVPEYWIINPQLHNAHLYVLSAEGAYERVEEREGKLHSTAIPGFWIKTEWLWQRPLPKVLDCLRELGVL